VLGMGILLSLLKTTVSREIKGFNNVLDLSCKFFDVEFWTTGFCLGNYYDGE